jgi:hypothetical protein
MVVTYKIGQFYASPMELVETCTLTVPPGVRSLQVECWGGGGGGAAGSGTNGGGGGGAGGYARRNAIRVIPGKTYTFTVGARTSAGIGGAGYHYGANGGATYFTGEDGVICQPLVGAGGSSTSYGTSNVVTLYADVSHAGGRGGNYSAPGGGGGGGECGGSGAAGANGDDGSWSLVSGICGQ